MDEQRPPPHPGNDQGDRQATFYHLLDQALDYFKTRKAEHWLMFFIGLILGIIIG